ncbi:MAG: hypothetical protein K940chlam6_00400 [Chlamydiae bacterium]|nr:hypothetical protein [Chlamydiota bacterium]NGX47274.1 hypothetical protein [Chlamydiota bacterium]
MNEELVFLFIGIPAFRIFSIAHIQEYELLRSFKIQGSDFDKIPILQFRYV